MWHQQVQQFPPRRNFYTATSTAGNDQSSSMHSKILWLLCRFSIVSAKKNMKMLRFGISMRDYIKPQLTALWILLKFFPCNVIHASKTATSYGFHFSGYITWNNNNKVTGCDHFWHCVLHNIPKTLLFRRGFTKYPNVLIFSSGNCKHKYCNIQWEKNTYNIDIVLTLPSAGLDSA